MYSLLKIIYIWEEDDKIDVFKKPEFYKILIYLSIFTYDKQNFNESENKGLYFYCTN